MPAVKPPTVRVCGTQYAIKKHGVIYAKEFDAYESVTLCGRRVENPTVKKFDPASEVSCGRCALSYSKRYAG